MEPRPGDYRAWAARWRVPLGFAVSIAYVVLARPTPGFLLAGSVLVLAGLALRAWAAGYLEKSSRLATAGPYALTRNPLYLGSSLLGAGFALAGRSVLMSAAFVILLAFIYAPVIRREAEFLQARFGEDYRRYAERVPLFWPRLGGTAISGERFEWSRYKKNREYEAALGCAAGIAFLTLKVLRLIPSFL